MPHLAKNPHEDWLVSLNIVEGFVKQKKPQEIFPFNWLYLKINVCKFQLTLLDHHITNIIIQGNF